MRPGDCRGTRRVPRPALAAVTGHRLSGVDSRDALPTVLGAGNFAVGVPAPSPSAGPSSWLQVAVFSSCARAAEEQALGCLLLQGADPSRGPRRHGPLSSTVTSRTRFWAYEFGGDADTQSMAKAPKTLGILFCAPGGGDVDMPTLCDV